MSMHETPPREAVKEGATPSAHGAFIWYELMTPDPDGAKAFYEGVVGWKVGERIPGDQEYRMIGRNDGGSAGGMLKLTQDMVQHGARPMWLGYVGVDDVDQTMAAIQQGGGKVLTPAFNIPQGRIAMVGDPQGIPLYVMKPVPPTDGTGAQQSDVFSPTEEQRVAWNELATTDTKAALAFYTSRFGWTVGDVMPMGELGNYYLLHRAGVMIGGLLTAKAGNPARWRYYFRVSDVGAAAGRVKEGGGVVAHGPVEVPGNDRVIIGFDPQGAEFALIGR